MAKLVEDEERYLSWTRDFGNHWRHLCGGTLPSPSRIDLCNQLTRPPLPQTQTHVLQASSNDSLLTPKESNQVMMIRALAWMARIGTTTLTPGEYHALVAEHPFDWISFIQASRLIQFKNHGYFASASAPPPWMNEILHKYTAYIALISRLHKVPDSRETVGPVLAECDIYFQVHLVGLSAMGRKGTEKLVEPLLEELLEKCGLVICELQGPRREGVKYLFDEV